MNADRHGSKRLSLFVCVYLWLISAAWAQVSVTLATKDGKSKFRVGEPIEVELRFQATESGKYGVWTTSLVRHVRRPEFDHFNVEHSARVVCRPIDRELCTDVRRWRTCAQAGPLVSHTHGSWSADE